ncbi:MAG TPA: 8-oxoguanine deaminase [Acidimicrobiia bacterium]
MATLLLKNIRLLATMDGAEIANASILARDGWVESVGPAADVAGNADEVVDLTDHVVTPGLINTHHHLYQTMTRAYPGAQDSGLFDWLKTLYPVWAKMTPEHVRVSTRLGLVELSLSGCTTAFDHHYLWPNGSRIDDQFEGAADLPIRFHVSRGSMSLGESQGGLPPDSVVEPEDLILEDSERAISEYHDASRGSHRRVVLAPCSPFSVTPDLMKESAALARSKDVRLHTHLAETDDEEQFCIDRFGKRPVEYMESLGWDGTDVWYAHAVHVADDEVGRMAVSGTGVAHCPTSNMRLASGIAPVSRYVMAGIPVGLGVDGSASNDSSNLLAEVRQAMLLNRLAVSPGIGSGDQISARAALEMATVGGAKVLGRDDIGKIAPGYAADFVSWNLNRLEFAGAQHDPLAALVFCTPARVDNSWVGGVRMVDDGKMMNVAIDALIGEQNRLSRDLFG